MPVSPKYIFRIQEEYAVSDDDKAEIMADGLQSKKWKDGYTNFKKNIRSHLKAAQRGRCAFCRLWVSVGTSHSNLEHLVGKKAYPQFEFVPSNIVYCCLKCNLAKGQKPTLTDPEVIKAEQLFPGESEGFLIVNPYHDNYEDHIDFIDNIIITSIAGSIKGSNTIEHYDLTRADIAEERARDMMLDRDEIGKRLLFRLTESGTSQSDMDQIKNIISELPRWIVEV